MQELKRSHEASQNECKLLKDLSVEQEATIGTLRQDLERSRATHERALKDKVKRDHRVAKLQKKLQQSSAEIDLLKKTQESYETDYYNLEDRMKVLRKRNSFLEVNLDKANRITDVAKKSVEMKEQECKLMASLINEGAGRAGRGGSGHGGASGSPSSLAPQFSYQQQAYGHAAAAAAPSEAATVAAAAAAVAGSHGGALSPRNLFGKGSGSFSGNSVSGLTSRNPLSGGANANAKSGAQAGDGSNLSIEDELAELCVSPDSLDSGSDSDEGQEGPGDA